MNKKKHIGQYHFLVKLISTFLSAALLPLCFFGWLFMNRAYSDVIRQNEKYYNQVAVSFNKSFRDQLTAMRACVARLDYERNIVRDTVEAHPYNYIDAIEELYSYKARILSSSEMFMHYHGADYVLSSEGKYGYSFFLTKFFKDSPDLQQRFESLMESQSLEKITILSEFSATPYASASMLVILPVKNYATVVFEITKFSFTTNFLGALDREDYGLMMFASGETLYDNSGFAQELMTDPEFTAFLSPSSDSLSFRFRSGGESWRAYRSLDEDAGIDFVVTVPERNVMQSRSEFYAYLGRILLYTGIFFLAIFAAVIYINYNPVLRIRRLAEKNSFAPQSAEDERPRGELSSIEYALIQFQRESDEMSHTVLEQTETIADFVLMNLIDGRPLPDQSIREANLAPEGGPYCIAAAHMRRLDYNQRVRLAAELSEHLGVHIYITKLLHERYTIFLCSGVPGTADERRLFAVALQNRLQPYFEENCSVGLGVVVDQMNDIRSSYLGALSAIESDQEGGAVLYEELIGSFDGVNDKYSEAVLKFLQHVRQGERGKAHEQLDSIASYILSHSSLIIEKYFCFVMVNDYLRLLSKLGLSPPENEISSLLNFNNTVELFGRLTTSVDRVCDRIANEKEQTRKNFSREVVAFVDAGFTDPDISLVKLSDEFGVSIYSLSRLFKEQTGIGYKEYVTAKRIEFSKYLLLSTQLSISEIAAQSGFIDSSSFSRMFKNNCGVSPQKFRER